MWTLRGQSVVLSREVVITYCTLSTLCTCTGEELVVRFTHATAESHQDVDVFSCLLRTSYSEDPRCTASFSASSSGPLTCSSKVAQFRLRTAEQPYLLIHSTATFIILNLYY